MRNHKINNKLTIKIPILTPTRTAISPPLLISNISESKAAYREHQKKLAESFVDGH